MKRNVRGGWDNGTGVDWAHVMSQPAREFGWVETKDYRTVALEF